jgi:hypothetical protein
MDDRARENGLLSTSVIAGESEDPATSAARVIAEQALSILEAAEASASEIRDRGRRQAEELVAATHEAAVLALSRLRAVCHELDGLATELDRKTETRLVEHGRGD